MDGSRRGIVVRANNELIYFGSSTVSSNSQCQLSDGWIRTSFQVNCVNGDLNGTFTVQGSNDLATGRPANQFTPTYWNNIGSTQSVVCSFSAGTSALIPWFDTCYRYHRVVYVRGNGGNTVGSFSLRVESKNL